MPQTTVKYRQSAPTARVQKMVQLGVALPLLHADDASRLIGVKKGKRNAKLHNLLHPCSGCGLPVLNGGARHESCPSSIPGLFDE